MRQNGFFVLTTECPFTLKTVGETLRYWKNRKKNGVRALILPSATGEWSSKTETSLSIKEKEVMLWKSGTSRRQPECPQYTCLQSWQYSIMGRRDRQGDQLE